jgi:hypothetical protein
MSRSNCIHIASSVTSWRMKGDSFILHAINSTREGAEVGTTIFEYVLQREQLRREAGVFESKMCGTLTELVGHICI